MQINFGDFNVVNQGSDEFLKICEQHESCVNCPMINGKVISIDGNQTYCNTGAEKNK